MTYESSLRLQRETRPKQGILEHGKEFVTGLGKFLLKAPGQVVGAPFEIAIASRGKKELAKAGFSPQEVERMQQIGAIGSLHPAVFEDVGKPQIEQFRVAKEAAQRGEYGQAALRGAAGTIPYLGPGFAEIGETAAREGRGEALKQALPLLLTAGLAKGVGALRARGAQVRTAPRPAPAPAPALPYPPGEPWRGRRGHYVAGEWLLPPKHKLWA